MSTKTARWAGRVINTKYLRCVGSGVTGRVYRLSKDYIVKVYCTAGSWYYKKASDLIALTQELDAAIASEWVLPIEEVVMAQVRNRIYYGAIKKYLQKKCSCADIGKIKQKLPLELRWDLHLDNIRKDCNGRVWLIDSHLNYE